MVIQHKVPLLTLFKMTNGDKGIENASILSSFLFRSSQFYIKCAKSHTHDQQKI